MSETSTVRGRVSIHPRGFGFLRLDVPGGDLAAGPQDGIPRSAFIPPRALARFLDGDLVDASLIAEDDGRFAAADLDLKERPRNRLFGKVIVSRGGKRRLRPDPEVANEDWPLEGASKIADDAWVLAEIQGRTAVRPKLVEDDEAPLVRVLARWSIRAAYPKAVIAAARASRRANAHRRDLRDVPTVTIDAPSTCDIDDALSVLPAQDDGAVRVLVSIADVDAWAPEGSPLDVEARIRGTSVYLPDRVIPMFPRSLSEAKASLLPDEERCALSVELRIDPEGEVRSVDVFETVIRSDARLSYEAVAAFLDEGRDDAVPAEVRETVRWLRTAAGRLSAVRAGRGGLSIVRDEARLTFDPATREPTAIEARSENSAHRLVERLMVAANEAVARWLHDRGLPALYRVHPSPVPERVASLAAFAANFGFETAFGSELTPRALAAFEAQFTTASCAPAIRAVLRRALGPARYTCQPEAHFGLAAPLYLHFTSPIRRYADLAVHRIIKRHLHGARDQVAIDGPLEELAAELNELAYRASKAEGDRLRMLAARLFAGRIGERFAGNVISVKPFGLIVQLEGTGVTGSIPIERLPGEGWRLDPQREALIRGSGSRARRYGIGAGLEVTVADADEERGEIELAIAETRRRPRERRRTDR